MFKYDEIGKVKTVACKRFVAVDFLRTIAIMAVVCVHNLPVPILNGGGWRIFVSAVVGSLSKIGVPIFLIITGLSHARQRLFRSKTQAFSQA